MIFHKTLFHYYLHLHVILKLVGFGKMDGEQEESGVKNTVK